VKVEAQKFGDNAVLEGEFAELTTVDTETRPGPWKAAVLSSFTGPVWVFVHGGTGSVVPLSSVIGAWR